MGTKNMIAVVVILAVGLACGRLAAVYNLPVSPFAIALVAAAVFYRIATYKF